MHLVGDDQRRHNKGRTSLEKMFKTGNMVVLAVQFACFLIVLSQTFIGANNTFRGSWMFPGAFELVDVIDSKTSNCSYSGTLDIEGYSNVPVTLNHANHGRMITDAAGEIRFCLILYILALGAGALNKLIFDLNLFHLIRIKHLVVHKELLTATELILIGFSLQVCWRTEGRSAFIVKYFDKCELDNTMTMFHVPPLVGLYVGQAVVIASHGVCLLILLYNTMGAEKIGGVSAYDTPDGQQRLAEETMQMDEEEGMEREMVEMEPEGDLVDADGNAFPQESGTY